MSIKRIATIACMVLLLGASAPAAALPADGETVQLHKLTASDGAASATGVLGLTDNLATDATVESGFDAHANRLAHADELLALNGAAYESDLHRAVALAKEGTYGQAVTLGLDLVDPVPLDGHTLPSSALAELLARHGVEPTLEGQARIDALDELDEPLRSVLARFVDAFLALDTAARFAYADADTEALERLLEDIRSLEHHDVGLDGSGDALQDAGVDLTLVFPTRNQFLDAILDLNDALTNHGVATASACAPIQLPPAFSIDLADCDNHYTEDVALLFDAGGEDTYHNNAGGSSHATGPCDLVPPGHHAPAALVDLGNGNDAYGDPLAPRPCGANGGGQGGVGFLLDAGGDDTYTARGTGTNGGGTLGMGFLLDASGDDAYTGATQGTNGGGQTGVGFLLDAGGNDAYTAGYQGTNGGGLRGVGFLLDAGGNDTYTADDVGTNGGGYNGVGFLLDAGGSDTYTAGSYGTNGGGNFGGVGFLLDAGGNDVYRAEGCATNGGGADASCPDQFDLPGEFTTLVGTLIDLGGADHYEDPAIPGGSCWDCTVVLKGMVGTQLDSDDPSL